MKKEDKIKLQDFWRGCFRLYCLRTAPEFQIQNETTFTLSTK